MSDERLHGALFGESERGTIVLARGVHLRRGSAEGDGAEQAQGRGLEAALATLARDNQCPGGALAAASGVTTEHVRFAELREHQGIPDALSIPFQCRDRVLDQLHAVARTLREAQRVAERGHDDGRERQQVRVVA